MRPSWCKWMCGLGMLALLAGIWAGPAALRGAEPAQDPDDPALRRAGKEKMTPEQRLRVRIAELEGGAITESMKTPETVTLIGPPLTDKEKVVHVFNRLAFGPRPGEIERYSLDGGWERWVKEQLDPDKIDDSKLEKTLAQRFPFMKRSMIELANEYPRYEQANLRKQFRESVVTRAVMSNRQFKEVMCEFWRNHFCVDAPDNDETERAYTSPDYEENVIRKHVFGKFKNMLFASATHPCMLEYLDNFKSRANNWNENYAREVMELHTLGADRYYNETDVLELSKVLTGWTYDKAYHFVFKPDWHQGGTKDWLGYKVQPGFEAGQQALAYLASHKGTAEFISFKLCRYLVNDNPPQALVKKVAQVFTQTDGDLPKVYEAIIRSPEFFQRSNYRAKFKTPFEFAVSALRITDAQVEDAKITIDTLAKMGQPVYNCKDPTGYYDQAEAWRDAGVLTSRWDYAWKMMRGSIPGVAVPEKFKQTFSGLQDKQLIDKMVETLIGSDIGTRTLDMMRKEAKDGKLDEMLSVLMGSPSFQQQ
jgi:uncharacterized protein (DUF1800 family)